MSEFKVGDVVKVIATYKRHGEIGLHLFNLKGYRGVILNVFEDGWYFVSVSGTSSKRDGWYFRACDLHRVI